MSWSIAIAILGVAVLKLGGGINALQTFVIVVGLPSALLTIAMTVLLFRGREIETRVRDFGCSSDFIEIENGLSRINVKLKSQEESEINGRGPQISEEALEKLFAQLDRLKKGDVLALAGSIPSSMPSDTYERIMARLENRGDGPCQHCHRGKGC